MKKRSNKAIKLVDSLESINKDLVNKVSKIDYIIYSKWPEIVGNFFDKFSKPERVSTLSKIQENTNTEYNENILHVHVSPAAALEFQHFQNKIIEKINSFFGYQAIHHIKIQQNFKAKNIQTYTKKISKFDNNLLEKKVEIKGTTQKINDKELKLSLMNLGLSVTKNENN